MAATVSRVMDSEVKRFKVRHRTDAVVQHSMHALLEAEEAQCRRERQDFQEHMRQTQEKDRVKRELKEATDKLQKMRKATREAEAVVAARQQIKAYSLQALGKGKKRAGGEQHHKARMEVMERLRRVAELTPEQTGAWDFFKTQWDRAMAEVMGEDWAETFAQIMQNIMNDLSNGKTNAFSDFMHKETLRALPTEPALMVPGAP